MGEARLALGSPLWLELEVSLGNPYRKNATQQGNIMREELELLLQSHTPPVPLRLLGSVWVG